MRQEASIWEKLFFTYAKPLLNSSMKERICFEQYGELPEHLKIEHELKKVEARIEHFMTKEPNSKYSVLKAVIDANKWKYGGFILMNFGISFLEMLVPPLLGDFIEYIEEDNDKLASYKTVAWAMKTTFAIMLLSTLSYTLG